MEKKYKLIAEGYDLDKIASKVCDLMQLEPFNIWATGKNAHGLRQEVYYAIGQ